MNRFATAVTTTVGLALFTLAIAPAAYADVTNPAVNPHKITVTGDDGNTYVDGQDTLPGYDDYECTYIPGAYFDFDNNRVRYPDGQSIPWTEWERATGYKEWLAKKNAAAQAAAQPAAAQPAAAQPAAGTTTGTNGTAAAAGATKPASSGKSASTSVQGAGGATAAADGAATLTASASPEVSASPSASETAQQSASPSAQANVALAAGTGSGGSGGAGSSAGLAILAGLFGLGGLAFGGYTFFAKGSKGRVA